MSTQTPRNIALYCVQLALHLSQSAQRSIEELQWIGQAREYLIDVGVDTPEKFEKMIEFLKDHECLEVQGDALAAPILFSYDDSDDQYGATLTFNHHTVTLLVDNEAMVISAQVLEEATQLIHDTQLLICFTPHQTSHVQISEADAVNADWIKILSHLKDFTAPKDFPLPRLKLAIGFAEGMAELRKSEQPA